MKIELRLDAKMGPCMFIFLTGDGTMYDVLGYYLLGRSEQNDGKRFSNSKLDYLSWIED